MLPPSGLHLKEVVMMRKMEGQGRKKRVEEVTFELDWTFKEEGQRTSKLQNLNKLHSGLKLEQVRARDSKSLSNLVGKLLS